MSVISSNGLQNQSEILKRNLQRINYQYQATFQIFQDKNPIVFLQILHYVVISFNTDFYKQLIDKGYELFSKSDQNFIQSVYKFLYKEYEYKPAISVEQFFTNIYLEKKLIMCNDIIEIILKVTNEKKKALQQQKLKQDKSKQQKNSNNGQDDEDQSSQVKLVKENNQIQGNLQKQRPSNIVQQQEDNEEQPRQLNLAAFKSQPLEQGEDIQQRKQQFSNQERFQNQQQQQNIQEQQQFRSQQQQQQQRNSSSNIQNNINQIKQDIQEIPQQQKFLQKSKEDMERQYNQMTDKFQKIVNNKSSNNKNDEDEDDEYENEQDQVQKENQNYGQQYQRNVEQQQQPQNKVSKQDRPVTARELNEVMKLILSLSSTMQETIQKLDAYQTSSNTKFSNVNAQLMILEGEVKLLRAMQENK